MVTSIRPSVGSVRAGGPGDAEGVQPTLSPKAHMVTCALATWMLFGLYIDGWAHRNLDLQDSITTPWHAVFYGGWITFAAWMVWLVVRERRTGKPWKACVTPGYGPGVVGVGIFMIGGLGDQVWHLALGVEQDLNAFMSPTHWLLAIGMFLMVSSPLRAGWLSDETRTPTMRQFAPWLWSMLLTTAMVSFTLNYISTFITDLPEVEPAFVQQLGPDSSPEFVHTTIERLRGMAVAQILLTTLVLMGMALHTVRRWRLPFGSLTIVFTGTALAVNGMWEYPLGWVAISAVVGGLTADVLVLRIDPRPSNVVAYRVFAGAVPAVMWLSYYAIMATVYEVNWPAPMWTGTILMASLISLLACYLMRPTDSPTLTEGYR